MQCQWRIRSTPSGTIQVSKLKSLKLVWWHWFAEKYKNSEAEVWKRSWTTMAKSVTRLSQESRCQQWLISWIRNKNKLTSPTWNLWWMSFLLTWKVSKCTARKVVQCMSNRARKIQDWKGQVVQDAQQAADHYMSLHAACPKNWLGDVSSACIPCMFHVLLMFHFYILCLC